MKTIACFVIACLFLTAFMLILNIRDSKVSDFRTRILQAAFGFNWNDVERENLRQAAVRIYDKHSYDNMLYSFRPLTYEAWFDEDEIRFLTEHKL